jgi:peptidoglycan/LPS O-acetylase OafA/YrhL
VAFIGAAGTPLVAVFNQTWSFPTAENSMHPDIESGKAIAQIDPLYPDYFEPTLTIITFSIGLQILVELSTWVQAFLSTKLVLWLHPHIMTIYLTHGFVMWTWGAFIAVKMNDAGAPYWANLLVNLVTTYIMIFLLASVLTPLMEVPTQGALRIMDRWTMKEPMKKRPMTAPFSKALIMDRQEEDAEETREV